MLLFAFFQATSQPVLLEKGEQEKLNLLLLNSDNRMFTGYRAFDWLELEKNNLLGDSIGNIGGLSSSSGDRLIKSRLLNESWLQWRSKNFMLRADPYIDGGSGVALKPDRYLPYGGAGGRIKGIFFDKLSFSFTCYAATEDFPSYVDEYILDNDKTVPGELKAVRNSQGYYRYTRTDAYLSFVPDKHITLTAAYGKIFIGDGYRSLLMSDNAAPFPYLRLKASYWKLTYNVIYSRYENDNLVNGKRQPKFSVMHYLGIDIGKKLQLGFFENTLWLGRDSNYDRGFDVSYLNPLVLMRPVEFSLGSTDNALMGATGKYTFDKGYIYLQAGIDDLNIGATLRHKKQHLNNKYFFQLGIWDYGIFGMKNLSWRLEWNAVRPYTYGHRKPEQNYTHNHQPLADPFGANFHEFISFFSYNRGRWYAYLENLLTLRGENPGLPYNNGEDLWGGEKNVPALGSKTLQGTRHLYFYHRLSAGWLINPQNHMALQAEAIYRQHSAPGVRNSTVIFSLGIRTNWFNHYYDW